MNDVGTFGLSACSPADGNYTNMLSSELENLVGAPFVAGNAVRLLRCGTEYFAAIFAALAAARHSICVEMYAIWDGEISSEFVRILRERAESGVAVRVIADAIGSRAWSKNAVELLRRAGVRIVLYNAIAVGALHRATFRTHRKLVIVDDTVAFAGGFNFVDVFSDSRSTVGWLDYVVEIVGPIVADAQKAFERFWQSACATIDKTVLNSRPQSKGPCGHSDVLVIPSPSPAGFRTVRAMHEVLVNSAKRTLSIRNPFFLPDEQMLRTIIAATNRGVSIRILVPGEQMEHHLLLHANRFRYRRLLDGGVKIFEYQPSMMHAKTVVADRYLSLIGSANFDVRSAVSNDELTFAVNDSIFAAKMESSFDGDLVASKEVRHPLAGGATRRCAQLFARSLDRFL